MESMTEKQAESFYKKQLRCGTVAFTGYYKYCFNWCLHYGNAQIEVSYGGGSDDIYRYEFDLSDITQKLPDTLEEVKQEYSRLRIKDKVSGKEYNWDGM